MPQILMTHSSLSEALETLKEDLELTDGTLQKGASHFQQTMLSGLKEQVHDDIKMLPSYVTTLPKGTESGKAFAIDVGGSNIRVLSVHLKGNGSFSLESSTHSITDDLKTCSSTQFCDFVADKVYEFLSTKADIDATKPIQPLKFGYTFSFPVKQQSLTKGILDEWTKGFAIQGFVGNDVVQLLNDSFKKKVLSD
jgi:hexokinase